MGDHSGGENEDLYLTKDRRQKVTKLRPNQKAVPFLKNKLVRLLESVIFS